MRSFSDVRLNNQFPPGRLLTDILAIFLFFIPIICYCQTPSDKNNEFYVIVYNPCKYARACDVEILIKGEIPFDADVKFDRELKKALSQRT